MSIRLLPDNVINQIAAGEVVERPASVVRELVDNAIDAGAREVSIYLEEGGRGMIRVADNGCGMSKDDALLACERHATSKISNAEDLNAIQTLGFRGEALSSIAAVSKMRLRTRRDSDPAAVEVFVQGGILFEVASVSGSPGTDIRVSGLFYNVPARRKFLRQPATEEARVKQWVLQSSIAHPRVRYRLQCDQRSPINLPPASSAIERGKSIFKGTLVSFEEEYGPLRLCGLLGHPSLAQADTNALVVLVNRRLVNDRMIVKAVREGFLSTLKSGEYPLGFISISLPSEEVDVNVHPQKSEVRFRSGQEVFRVVKETVRKSVKDFTGPVYTAANDRVFSGAAAGAVHSVAAAPISFDWVSSPAGNPAAARIPESPQAAPEPEKFTFSSLRYIGQALNCFLVCEFGNKLYLVDMHAAHERYNYNLLRNRFAQKTPESQVLLIPQAVQLTEAGARNCLASLEMLRSFGFEIEPFGDSTVLVRSAPALLSDAQVGQVIKEIAADELSSTAAVDGCVDAIAARIACHASIRSGYHIDREEVYSLFASLDSTEFSAACPHGRPVIVSFSGTEVQAWFGRDR